MGSELRQEIRITAIGDEVFVTDSEGGKVIAVKDGVSRLVAQDLLRPWGIAAVPGSSRLAVVEVLRGRVLQC